MSFRWLCLVSALAFISLASPAQATDLLTGIGSGSSNTSSHNNTLGYDFTVGANPLLVTDLGTLFTATSSGSQVGLWTDTGVLLGEVSATNHEGSFLWGALSVPVTLDPNTTYVLGAHDPVGETLIINGAGQTQMDSNVTVHEARIANNVGFAYPSGIANSESYVGPNARYTVLPVPVPEPSPLAYIAAGLTAFIVVVRRRRSATAGR
jgi:hypothetical protein